MGRSMMSPPPFTSALKPATGVVSNNPLKSGPDYIHADAPYGRLVANVFLHPIKVFDVIPGHLADLKRFGIAIGVFVVSTLLLGAAYSTVTDPDIRHFFKTWANVPEGPVLGHLLMTSVALVVLSAVTALVGRVLSRGGSFFATLTVFVWLTGLTNALFTVAAFAPGPIALFLGYIVAFYGVVFYFAAMMSLYDLSLVEAIFAAIIVQALEMAIAVGLVTALAGMGLAGLH